MDPAALIPTPDTIPVPWGWFQILLIVTFILHILFMNAVVGGGIIALVNHLREPQGSPTLCKQVAHKLTPIIAFTINLGIAPLLFLQVLYGQFFYTSTVLMAVHWLSIIGLVILAYASAYVYHLKYKALGVGRARILALTVLPLLVVGFLLTNNMTLMLRPAAWTAYFAQPNGTLLNLADPTLVPRYLHFMTAAVAVGGLFIALLNHGHAGRDPGARRRYSQGMQWFVFATLAQVGIGFWFLMSLPEHVRALLLGDNALATGLLVLGLGTGLTALGLAYRQRFWPTVIAAVATVSIMALVRDLVRRAYLAPYFSISDLTVAPEYSPLVLFLILFAVTGWIVYSMLRLGWQALRPVNPPGGEEER